MPPFYHNGKLNTDHRCDFIGRANAHCLPICKLHHVSACLIPQKILTVKFEYTKPIPKQGLQTTACVIAVGHEEKSHKNMKKIYPPSGLTWFAICLGLDLHDFTIFRTRVDWLLA